MSLILQKEPLFDEKEQEACNEYLKSGGWLMEHKKTREFECMISAFTGSKYCHVVSNGTISLSIALLAFGIKSNDKVLVPNLTMVASPNAVKLIGAIPILVDIEPLNLNIDLELVKKIVTEHETKNDPIKCIMHVSLNTRCNDIEQLRIFCEQKNIYLLEDAAQSLGSYHNGKHLGTFGHIGSFSFSVPKIITTGQGGCLVTDDPVLSKKIEQIKNFGREEGNSENYAVFGINAKFTDLQACIGIEQIKKLPERILRMKYIWNFYYQNLKDTVFMIPNNNPDWISWFVDIFVPDTAELANFLKSKNIQTRPVYKTINNLEPYREYKNKPFPISEKYSKHGLWLPSSVQLTDNQLQYICDSIKEFFNTHPKDVDIVNRQNIFVIRKLLKTDYQQYIPLISKFRPIDVHVDQNTFETTYDTIFKSGGIFVLENTLDNKLVGSVSYFIEQKFIFKLCKFCHIEDVIIDENYRKLGLGKSLIQYCREFAKSENCIKLTLVCSESNSKFYEKCELDRRGLQYSCLL